MTTILPPPQDQGGPLSQFFGGVARGLGDDLPDAMNAFFRQKQEQKAKTQLQDILDDLQEASVMNRKTHILQSKVSDSERKKLMEIEDLRGMDALSKRGSDISEEDILKNASNPQLAHLMLSLRSQQLAQEKQQAAIAKEADTERQQFAKDKNTFLKSLPGDVREIIGKDAWELLSEEDRKDLINFGSKSFDEARDPVEARRLTVARALGEDQTDEFDFDEQPEIESPFSKGRESGIRRRAASLISGEPLSEYEKRTALPEDSTWYDRASHGLGKFIEDFPFWFGGGAAGAAAGTALGTAVSAPTLVGVPVGAIAGSLAGGGAGAFAVPSMIEKGLSLYQGYLEKGGKATFGDFLDASAETLATGVDAGLEGAVFGTLSKLKPFLSKNPIFKRLFNIKGLQGKAVETLVQSSFQTGGILGSRVVSGQKISSDDAVDLFTQVFGLNVLGGLHPKLKKSVANKIEKSGIDPVDFTQNVQERLKEQNQNPNNPIHLHKAVTDVSNEYSKAKEVFEKAQKPKVGVEQLEKVRTEKKALAERIVQEPVEEILKEKKPTKKVQEAQEIVKDTETKVESAEKDLSDLKSALEKEKSPKKSVALQGVVKLKNEQVNRLKENLKTQEAKVESLKPVKQTPEALKIQINEHNRRIRVAAKDPLGQEASHWKQLFERDQQYFEQLKKQIEKGELPTPKQADSYLNILDGYQKSYQDLLKRTKSELKKLQGKKGKEAQSLKKDILELDRLLKTNSAINAAKQRVHNPKNYIRQLAKGRGDVYLKQFVKNAGVSAKQFQKDFFKVREVLDATEAKTERVSDKILKKSIQNVIENPTIEHLETLSKESGIPVKALQEAAETGKEMAKEIQKSVEKGTPFKDFIKKKWPELEKRIKKDTKKAIPKIGKAMIGAVVFGSLQKSIEGITGIKVPYTGLTLLTPGTYGIRFGATIMANVAAQIYNRYEEWHWKGKLSKTRSIREKSALINSLKKRGWTSSRLRKLRK